LSCGLQAQVYYQDVIGTHAINQMIQLYKTNHVKKVSATSFDGDGNRSSEYFETHEFFLSNNLLKISTINKQTPAHVYYRFDAQGRVTSISDSSFGVASTSNYTYDAQGNLSGVQNISEDASDSIHLNEMHQWFYDVQNHPVRMLRIVNRTDTTDTRFTLDDRGNVIEEIPFKNRVSREKTYYYYDDNNRLTDIVRYNLKVGKLLPDYMFEYSTTNQVLQKVTTLSTMGLGYLIWRYVYDDKGLKTKEATFNRDKVMTGKIEYSYEFGQ
jgi:YD repeat-containing protein